MSREAILAAIVLAAAVAARVPMLGVAGFACEPRRRAPRPVRALPGSPRRVIRDLLPAIPGGLP